MKEDSEKLLADVRQVVSDIDEYLKSRKSRVATGVKEARQSGIAALQTARDELAAFEEKMLSNARKGAEHVDRYARENPWAMLGAAAVAAFVAGYGVARKMDGRGKAQA
ncbi:MAG: hypothetical protein R3E77_10225 [Steroidobacteraceae bacterium]